MEEDVLTVMDEEEGAGKADMDEEGVEIVMEKGS